MILIETKFINYKCLHVKFPSTCAGAPHSVDLLLELRREYCNLAGGEEASMTVVGVARLEAQGYEAFKIDFPKVMRPSK